MTSFRTALISLIDQRLRDHGLIETVEPPHDGDDDTDTEPTPPHPVGKPGENWTLTLDDQFDQGGLDDDIWSLGYGWGRTANPKLEHVTSDMVWVDDSADQLVIKIDHTDDYSMDPDDPENNGWYSGAINTKDNHAQQHGYWEARLKPPMASAGLLPAFWAKPNNEDWPPEIDVVEWMGDRIRSVHHAHYEDADGRDDWGHYHDTGQNLAADFHVYGCEWTPEEVIWYLDGEEVCRTSEASGTDGRCLDYGEPFYTMLSCHVWDRDWLGGSPAQNTYPQQFRADWVRVWKRGE